MSIPPRTAGGLYAQGTFFARNISGPAQQFIHTEGASGRLLLMAALLALGWANSPWSDSYDRLWGHEISLNLGFLLVDGDLRHWVNDALMPIFFYLITLEVKREITRGELSTRRKAALPVAAAIGGMMLPAILFVVINANGGDPSGWGIPIATDTAFALGALALIGKGAPPALITLLLATAVVDDVSAMLVIAFFYTEQVNLTAAAIAAAMFFAILAAQRLGVQAMSAYLVIAVALWLAVMESGVHATIAGVLMGALTPARPTVNIRQLPGRARPLIDVIEDSGDEHDPETDRALGELEALVYQTESPLERLEHKIHPWSGYVVLPLFALANAGITLSGETMSNATSSAITAGVLVGLWIGKPVGIFLGAWLAVRLGMASLPARVTWAQVAGIGALSGIGFSVSIFITELAYSGTLAEEAKVGILIATVLAALTAYPFFRMSRSKVEPEESLLV